ncbi:MAG: hypothetical protein FWE11_06645 [Defluviitaleaceae bacterium]|nr:hypothetical protein [Defluviitaleaceae bacterium]
MSILTNKRVLVTPACCHNTRRYGQTVMKLKRKIAAQHWWAQGRLFFIACYNVYEVDNQRY